MKKPVFLNNGSKRMAKGYIPDTMSVEPSLKHYYIGLLICLFIIMGCAAGGQQARPSPYDTIVKSVLVESVSELNFNVASIKLSRPSMFFGILKTTPIKFNGRLLASGRCSSGQ